MGKNFGSIQLISQFGGANLVGGNIPVSTLWNFVKKSSKSQHSIMHRISVVMIIRIFVTLATIVK